jgi:hypothetical protein
MLWSSLDERQVPLPRRGNFGYTFAGRFKEEFAMLRSSHIAVAFLAISMRLLCSESARAQDKAADPKPPPRESLRYDGKPFEYWQTYWQTELKAERRVECLRAMGAFGSNGYGPEAAAAIVGMVCAYEESAFATRPFSDHYALIEPQKLRPDERVYYEAAKALEKIGSLAVPALLAHAKNPNLRSLTHWLLAEYDTEGRTPADALPALVRMALADNGEERSLALDVLHNQIYRNQKLANPLVKALARRGAETKFLKVVLGNICDGYSTYCPVSTEAFLTRLAPDSPNLVPVLIAELRELKKTRQKDVEGAKKEFSSRGPSEYAPTWEAFIARYPSASQSATVVIVDVLGNIGAGAHDALPELREALEDPYLHLQNAARTAIEQITKKQP